MHNIRQKYSNQMTHSGIMHNIRQKYSNQWHTVVLCTIFAKNTTNDTQWYYAQYSPKTHPRVKKRLQLVFVQTFLSRRCRWRTYGSDKRSVRPSGPMLSKDIETISHFLRKRARVNGLAKGVWCPFLCQCTYALWQHYFATACYFLKSASFHSLLLCRLGAVAFCFDSRNFRLLYCAPSHLVIKVTNERKD